MSEQETIVVGYVKTAEGEAALTRAVAETKLRGARLMVVHSLKGGERNEDEMVLAYRDALEKVDKRLAGEGIPYEVHEFIRGNEPSQDLIQTAKETGADLIVIGLRRRTPTGKYLLGSNAQDIMLDADCPVLAVKAAKT